MSLPAPALTALRAGLVGCRNCGQVSPMGTRSCTRCGGRLEADRRMSLQRVWAWLIAGLIFYIPANVLPMLVTETLTTGDTRNTILGGVVELVHAGDWGVATIVFVASIVVPVAKFIAIGLLALTLGRRRMSLHRRHGLLLVVDFIGRWSMIDVFVVAILSALVQLGKLAAIHPGPAALFFALSVAFTMLAAQSFDPRLIWERDEGTAA